MSEQRDDGDWSGCILWVFVIAGLIISGMIVRDELNKRDNWIRDLQRRIAVLEQERR